MKSTLALVLVLNVLGASISLADTLDDYPALKAAAAQTGVAIRFCGQYGPSLCGPKLREATDQLIAAFDTQKSGLSGLSCGYPAWDTVPELYVFVVKEFGQGIAEMMDKTLTFGGAPGLTKGEAVRYVDEFSMIFDRLLQFGAEVHLSVGNQALQAGCRKEADKNYRAVLSRFTGDRLASFRERAQVGIADVRSSGGLICRITGYC